MKKTSGTPWNFAEEYSSPDGRYKLRFFNVGEVGMSAPLGGGCYLEFDGRGYELPGHFGGPVAWNEHSTKAALPYWTKKRSQRLAVVDVEKMELLLSEEIFRVIQLSHFEDELICGVDSPIYLSEKIEFDLRRQPMGASVEIR